jgi:peptidoglycan/xylan/chitin deacetylase (PgdA/CDA1 family)
MCLVLGACGSSGAPRDARSPRAAPEVALSAADRALWRRGEPRRDAVPVLVYRRVAPLAFARQMALLDHAGYDTIALDDFVRFVRREPVSLPPRPMLLTFDGGRLDSWTATDLVLRDRGFGAVVFVDVGRVEAQDPAYLSYGELNRMQEAGRWDVQLQSGTGHRRIQYGPAPGDVGPFYAYRGSEEVLGGWRERVFSDVTYGEEQLRHVRGYRPLAFAPPYGNYGQAGTNDRRIPKLLLERLELSFAAVFTQDRDGFAIPGARNPLGRYEITPRSSEAELHTWLERGPA